MADRQFAISGKWALAALPSTFGEWTRKRAQTCGETVSVDG